MRNALNLQGLLLAAVLLLPQAALAKFEFIPMLEASLAANSAKIDAEYAATRTDNEGNVLTPDSNSSGQNLWLYTAGNFRFTEVPNLWITPVIEFEHAGANNLVKVEDEAFIWAKRLNLYYLLGANYKFNQVWSAKLKGFGRMENTMETNDESLETGLYNYRDAGVWIEGAVNYKLGWPMRAKMGGKAFTRRYPNYSNSELVAEYERTVETWPEDLPKDLHEKDVNVNEYWLRHEMTWGAWPVLTNLELRWKLVNYTEMPAIFSDGTFSDDLRRDGYVDARVEVPFIINPYNQFEIDYTYSLHASNQGVYSSSEALYLEAYYNYIQHEFSLLYNFSFPFKITSFSPKGSIILNNQRRAYLGRPSKQRTSEEDTTGAYNYADPHWENHLDLGVTLKQQLFAQWFSLFLSAHFITLASNTDVEDNATYNLKYNTFTLGTALSF